MLLAVFNVGLQLGFLFLTDLLAVLAAAVVCPLVNTSIFFLGCWAFFLQDLALMAGGVNVFVFILTVFIGINILVEVGINVVLSPVILRLIRIGKK